MSTHKGPGLPQVCPLSVAPLELQDGGHLQRPQVEERGCASEGRQRTPGLCKDTFDTGSCWSADAAQVTATARELSGDPFTRFNNEINKKIFELIHSSDASEKLGAIVAIGIQSRSGMHRLRLTIYNRQIDRLRRRRRQYKNHKVRQLLANSATGQ